LKKLVFIALAAILALSIGLVGCGGGGTTETCNDTWNYTIQLRCHFTAPDSASICAFVYIPWIAELEALNNSVGGQGFQVTRDTPGDTPYDSSQGLWALSGGKTGVVDMGQVSGDTFHLGTLGYLPFLYPNITSAAYAQQAILTENNGAWAANGELDQVKILVVSTLWPSELWMSTLSGMNITSPTQLNTTVRLRADGEETYLLQALNTTPIAWGTSSLAQGLQNGNFDGLFFTYSGYAGWGGLGPYISYITELDAFYRMYVLMMNKDVYDCMPPLAQSNLSALCTPDIAAQYAAYHIDNMTLNRSAAVAAGKVWVADGSTITAFNDTINAANYTQGWKDRLDDASLDGSGIYDRILELIVMSPL